MVEVEDDEEQGVQNDVIGAKKATSASSVARDDDEEMEEGEIRSDDED